MGSSRRFGSVDRRQKVLCSPKGTVRPRIDCAPYSAPGVCECARAGRALDRGVRDFEVSASEGMRRGRSVGPVCTRQADEPPPGMEALKPVSRTARAGKACSYSSIRPCMKAAISASMTIRTVSLRRRMLLALFSTLICFLSCLIWFLIAFLLIIAVPLRLRRTRKSVPMRPSGYRVRRTQRWWFGTDGRIGLVRWILWFVPETSTSVQESLLTSTSLIKYKKRRIQIQTDRTPQPRGYADRPRVQ